MPEPDTLASAEDLRQSIVPLDNSWAEPSPLTYGRRASLGALLDTISEEDALLMSDADLQAVRADAIARWAQKADIPYLQRSLAEVARQLDWMEREERRRRRLWIKAAIGLGLVWAWIILLLHCN
ncbi:MAG TPA: hypothetical protein VJK02_21205 [Anaerolineales bacterium]|nr:hypothetical protein [Anaerolineales bacterium]